MNKAEIYIKENPEYEMYLVDKKFGNGKLLIHFFYREQIRQFKQGFLAYVDNQKWYRDHHAVMDEVQDYLINKEGVLDEADYDNELDGDIFYWRKEQFPKIDLEYGGVCYFDVADQTER